MTHKPQTPFHSKDKVSILLRGLIVLILSLSFGFAISHFLPNKKTAECKEPKLRTIQLIISSGTETKNWNNISLNEGESVATILDRVNKVNDVGLVLAGEKKHRTIQTLLTKESSNGEWKYYINAAPPLPLIDSFYPKAGDVISVVYNSNN